MNIAIVTGASSGLGKAYVSRIVSWPEIDEIWVIARRQERLASLASTSKKIKPMAFDLSDETEIERFSDTLATVKPVVSLLINAAGFGKLGTYRQVGRKESDRMIDLNCRAAVDMTQIALDYMVKGGRIMEICSTAAFQPFQGLAIYAASKAFLYRYSRALRVELLTRGISVTAVCPYWIKDTEFIPVAKETEKKPVIRHYILASRVRSVARWSLFDARHRFAVSTPGPICLAHRIVAKFVPSELMMGLWAILRRL